MLWFPFGKLTHAFTIFLARGVQGVAVRAQGGTAMSAADMAVKGAVADKQGQTPRPGTRRQGDAGLRQRLRSHRRALHGVVHPLRHVRRGLPLLRGHGQSEVHADLEDRAVQTGIQARVRAVRAGSIACSDSSAKSLRSSSREWQDLLYDSCTVCGRCSLDVPDGHRHRRPDQQCAARHGRAGLVPKELRAVADERTRAQRSASGPHELQDALARARSDGIFPLDKPRPRSCTRCSSTRSRSYPEVDRRHCEDHEAPRRRLDHAQRRRTTRPTSACTPGTTLEQKEASVKLIDAAVACGAKTLILPECGHAYGALRWDGANIYGKPLPFKVLHISEFLADSVRDGKLKLQTPSARRPPSTIPASRRGAGA